MKEKEKEEKLIAETAAAVAQSNSFRSKLAEAIKMASLDDSNLPDSPPRRGRGQSSLPACFFDPKNRVKSKTRGDSQTRLGRGDSQTRLGRGDSQTRLGRAARGSSQARNTSQTRTASQTRLNKQSQGLSSPKKTIYSSTSAPCLTRKDALQIREKERAKEEKKPRTASSTTSSHPAPSSRVRGTSTEPEGRASNKPRLPSIPTQKRPISKPDLPNSRSGSAQPISQSASRKNSVETPALSAPTLAPSPFIASSRIFSSDSKKSSDLDSLNFMNESLYNLLEAEAESISNDPQASSLLPPSQPDLPVQSTLPTDSSLTQENQLDINDCLSILKKYEKSKVPSDQGEIYSVSNTNELLYKSANKLGTNLNKVENILKSYDDLKLNLL